MTALQAYIAGIKTTFQSVRIWGIMYAGNLLFALVIVFPLTHFIESNLGSTNALQIWSDAGFDFTVFSDFLMEYGDILPFVQQHSLIAVGLFFFISVFFTGGLINSFQDRQMSPIAGFWSGGAQYYWRILRLTIYFLFFQGVLLVLFFRFFLWLTAGGLAHFHNEMEIVWRVYWVLPIYIFLAGFLWIVRDYAKIITIRQQSNWLFRPIMKAFRWAVRHFIPVFLLAILNLLTFLFFFWLGNKVPSWLDGWLPMLLFGQLLLILQIGTKILYLSSANFLYHNKP